MFPKASETGDTSDNVGIRRHALVDQSDMYSNVFSKYAEQEVIFSLSFPYSLYLKFFSHVPWIIDDFPGGFRPFFVRVAFHNFEILWAIKIEPRIFNACSIYVLTISLIDHNKYVFFFFRI